jgi:hypothetical protein
MGATAMTRYRLAILSRLVAAFGGGHVLTSLGVALASRWSPQIPAGAILWATMAGFLAYPVIVMMVFHARSAGRAWLWISGCSAIAALLIQARPGL